MTTQPTLRLYQLPRATSISDDDLFYGMDSPDGAAIDQGVPASVARAYMLGSGVTFDNANGNLLFDAGGIGKEAISYGPNSFNGTIDPTIYFGYNQKWNGSLITPNEPGLSWTVEGNYNDGSGQNKMEAYLQYVPADGSSPTRPLFFQINRVTNVVTATAIQGNPVRLLYPLANNQAAQPMVDFQRNTVIVYAPLANTDTVFRLSATAGRTANFRLGYDTVDDVSAVAMANRNIMHIQVDGAGSGNASLRTNSLWLFGRVGATPADAMSIGVQDNLAAFTAMANSFNTMKALVARGQNGQNGNIFEVQDYQSNIYLAVNKVGVLLPIQAPTASAPAYVKGGMYFDTTLNKLRIGGASNWETVTSV